MGATELLRRPNICSLPGVSSVLGLRFPALLTLRLPVSQQAKITAPALPLIHQFTASSFQIYAGAAPPRLRPRENTIPCFSTVATHPGSASKTFLFGKCSRIYGTFPSNVSSNACRGAAATLLNLLQIPLSYTHFVSL